MNYKCTNAECGWEGTLNDLQWNKRLYTHFRCPECESSVKQLNYTRMPPAKTGCYWWRHNEDDIPRMYEVYFIAEKLQVEIDGDWTSVNSILDGEWSERIEPPT